MLVMMMMQLGHTAVLRMMKHSSSMPTKASKEIPLTIPSVKFKELMGVLLHKVKTGYRSVVRKDIMP